MFYCNLYFKRAGSTKAFVCHCPSERLPVPGKAPGTRSSQGIVARRAPPSHPPRTDGSSWRGPAQAVTTPRRGPAPRPRNRCRRGSAGAEIRSPPERGSAPAWHCRSSQRPEKAMPPGGSRQGLGVLGETQPYLGILHEIIAALEPVVELRHPPGGDDLDVGQGVRWGRARMLALLHRPQRGHSPRGVGRGAPLGRGRTGPAAWGWLCRGRVLRQKGPVSPGSVPTLLGFSLSET